MVIKKINQYYGSTYIKQNFLGRRVVIAVIALGIYMWQTSQYSKISNLFEKPTVITENIVIPNTT